MNIEELRLVLATVEGLAGDAKEVVILYFFVNYGVGLVYAVIAAAVVVFVARVLVRMAVVGESARWAIHEINQDLGYPGSRDPYFAHEFRAIVSAVRKLKE